jgi:hypothetical protein
LDSAEALRLFMTPEPYDPCFGKGRAGLP